MNETLAVVDFTFGVSPNVSNSGVGWATAELTSRHRRRNCGWGWEEDSGD